MMLNPISLSRTDSCRGMLWCCYYRRKTQIQYNCNHSTTIVYTPFIEELGETDRLSIKNAESF